MKTPFWHKKERTQEELTSDKMHQLLLSGDFTKLKAYLDSPNIIEQRFTKAKYTVIHVLAGFRDHKFIEILEYLLSKQKNNISESYLNCTETNSSLTACHIAALEGNPEVLRLLVQHGADPTLKTNPECGAPLALADKYRHQKKYDDKVFNSIKEIIENYSKIYQAAVASNPVGTNNGTSTTYRKHRSNLSKSTDIELIPLSQTESTKIESRYTPYV